VCPKCGFLSAGQAASNDPFGVGDRVRCGGYCEVGARTDTAVSAQLTGDICVHVTFDKGTPTRQLTLRLAGKRDTTLCRTRARR
jgi:hypothetical protein